ncbi:hypothetical protein [Pandoravirus japonicus]|uniref:Uncharacterized protein n=1 Tax=Pandoravirus japonicus TaxID=2823154 RepID=A0A811BPD9_9VIRU|nr:hypothetical protein [Pandoravirus japonicus]
MNGPLVALGGGPALWADVCAVLVFDFLFCFFGCLFWAGVQDKKRETCPILFFSRQRRDAHKQRRTKDKRRLAGRGREKD